jgi:hypothetical protein
MDNQTEKYYLKNARLNFSNEVDKHNLPIELLTAIDSFLLAYDYAVNKIEQL